MKTQKSFRKRALLSSVAMLLVALVALGSATFAWFTQSPTATASGLTMKATSANGLKILTESRNASSVEGTNKDFASSDLLNYYKKDASSTPVTNPTAFYLDPVSIAFTAGTTKLADAKAYSTTAVDDNNYAADTTGKTSEVETVTGATYNTGKYYEEDISCKLVGVTDSTATADIKLNGLSVSFGSAASDLKNSVRILVSYNGTIIGGYANTARTDTADTRSKAISAITESSADSGKYYYKDATLSAQSFSAWGDVATTPLALGKVGTAGSDKVTVTIYLDGEDGDCYAQHIDMNEIISSVTVSLTIA